MSSSLPQVGFGFDVHRFSSDESRPLVLAGVTIAGSPGLEGHSDADVITHAVIDALLGAACLGDIGEHFSDTDAQWKGADSIDLLKRTMEMMNAEGWLVTNIDCTVVLEAPKIGPHRQLMVARLHDVVNAPLNIKASRAEGLGALGRVEGVACWAVANLHQSTDVVSDVDQQAKEA